MVIIKTWHIKLFLLVLFHTFNIVMSSATNKTIKCFYKQFYMHYYNDNTGILLCSVLLRTSKGTSLYIVVNPLVVLVPLNLVQSRQVWRGNQSRDPNTS